MSARDDILKDLYRSLPVPKPLPSPVPADAGIFSDYPAENSDLKKIFATHLEQLHGELIMAGDLKEAAAALYRLIAELPDKSCLACAPDIMAKMFENRPELKKKIADEAHPGESSPEFARLAAGITGADYLIARSGSIILSAVTGGGRRLSVLPPLHIVLGYANQLVPSLDTAVANLPDSSYLTIITGPSRTSDIEKKLVLGAHGPKRLVVIMIG
jgi:L-lactate dehydrogenase complex protein LldG